MARTQKRVRNTKRSQRGSGVSAWFQGLDPPKKMLQCHLMTKIPKPKPGQRAMHVADNEKLKKKYIPAWINMRTLQAARTKQKSSLDSARKGFAGRKYASLKKKAQTKAIEKEKDVIKLRTALAATEAKIKAGLKKDDASGARHNCYFHITHGDKGPKSRCKVDLEMMVKGIPDAKEAMKAPRVQTVYGFGKMKKPRYSSDKWGTIGAPNPSVKCKLF